MKLNGVLTLSNLAISSLKRQLNHPTRRNLDFLKLVLKRITGMLFPHCEVIQIQNNIATIEIRRSCPLGSKGEIFCLPAGKFILESVRTIGSWEEDISNFLARETTSALNYSSGEKRSDKSASVTLLDLGAHVGLIPIQIARNLFSQGEATVKFNLILVEPMQQNMSPLQFNIGKLGYFSEVHFEQAAVSNHRGKTRIYRDSRDSGNTSLLRTNVAEENLIEEECKVIHISDLGLKLHTDSKLLLKSDLQGLDAHVLSEMPEYIWQRIYAGVIEVGSKPEVSPVSVANVLRRLEPFEKYTSLNTKDTITPQRIYDLWTDKSGREFNLFIRRPH